MEHPIDRTLHLDMVPRTSNTLYVKEEFVISNNLSIRVPPGLAALLEKGRPTRTLRPNWLEFPYRIGFNAILFVETGVVDCILNLESFHIDCASVLMIPSATLMRDLTWQAGTKFILFGYNDGKLFSAMTSRSAKILKASMIAPFVLTMDRERMERYMHLIKVLIHVASGGPDYDFQDDIIDGAAQMFSGGLARLVMERMEQRTRVPREMTITQDFIRMVQARCLEHRDLDYYARELCITPKYLSRIISKVAGKKALLIIQENVIAEAESLLKDGNYNVQQISDILHFPTPSYFCRYFRKATGMTPRAYMLAKV